MSNFTKVPYIESILSELSGENKTKLLNFINGKGADGTGSISYAIISQFSGFAGLGSGVTAVDYIYKGKINWKGYVIKTTNHFAFITFQNNIDLTMARIYKILSDRLLFIEDVTSDNLRALLREDAYVDVSELAAASGSGGAKLYSHFIEFKESYSGNTYKGGKTFLSPKATAYTNFSQVVADHIAHTNDYFILTADYPVYVYESGMDTYCVRSLSGTGGVEYSYIRDTVTEL